MNTATRTGRAAAVILIGILGAFDDRPSDAGEVRQEFLVMQNPEEGSGNGAEPYRFGRSIAFDQGRLLVGDPLGLKENGGSWGRAVLFSSGLDPVILNGEDVGPGDRTSCMSYDSGGACPRFGSAVDLHGLRAAVGEPWREDPGDPGERPDLGRVSIIGLEDTEVIQHVIEPSDRDVSWGFGSTVLLREDVLLVGIAGFQSGIALRGGVEVFDTTNFASLGMLPRAKGSGPAGVFGLSMAADAGSERVIVGSVPDPGSGDPGAAHIYAVSTGGKTGPPRLDLLASLFPPAVPGGAFDDFDGFGSAVAIDGIHAAVSAPGRDGDGVVILYREEAPGEWSMIDMIEAPAVEDMSVIEFGDCLDLEEGILFVGAPGTSFNRGWTNTGAVFGIPIDGTEGCTRIYRASEARLERLGSDIEVEDGHLHASATGPSNGGGGRVLSFSVTGADVDGNGTVNVSDLLGVINGWGACSGSCLGDTNCDGRVDVTDLLAVIAEWHGLGPG